MVCLYAQCLPTVFGCKLYSAHVWKKPRFLLLVITLAWKWQIASLTFQRVICDRKYRDLSVSQISRYFAQPCPIIVNYLQKVEYHKCCTDLSVSQISRYFAQPCPIIVNYLQKVEYHKCCTTWSFSGLNCLYFPNIFIKQNQSWLWTDFAKYERFSTTSKIPSKGILPHPPTTGSVNANGLLSFPLTV